MLFSQEFIEKVSEANNLVDIISQYTQLKPTGSGLMGRCPFPDHAEKTPSFSVSENKQVYHCFGCHKKGNIFTFLQHYNGMNFPEAIEYLAARANIELPVAENNLRHNDQQIKQKKQSVALANKEAMSFFMGQLQKASPQHPVKKYILARGLSEETIKTFCIGYAPPDWEGLEQYLKSKNISSDSAVEARLIKARTQGKSGHYDIFRDRLMFPIFSALQEPVAFGGRIIESGEPKYLNSPETSVFTKGKILYGLSQTASYMRSEDQVIIVEGYMDLVSLYQAGVRNVVATMGTALTPDQCRLIKRITKNVVVLFDGDSAGVEAAEKSLPLLLEAELYPKGLTLPDQQDPDDYVKKYGCEALVTMLQQAPDLFSLVTKNWMQGYTGEASEKVRLCDRLQDIFKAIKDQRLKQLYFEEIAKKLSVTIAWLQQAVEPRVGTGRSSDSTAASLEAAKALRTSTSGPSNKDAADNMGPNITNVDLEKDLPRPAKYSLKGATRSELILMSLAIKTRANMDLFIKENMQNSVTHTGALGVLQKAQEVYRHEPAKFDKLVSLFVSEVDFPDGLFTESLLKMKDAEMTKNVVNVDLMDSLTEHKLMRDCSKRNKQSQLKLQAKQLLKDLKSGVDSETLEQIMNVQRDRYSLNKN